MSLFYMVVLFICYDCVTLQNKDIQPLNIDTSVSITYHTILQCLTTIL